MSIKTKLLPVAIFLFLIPALYAQKPANYDDAMRIYRIALAAFAENDYDKAIGLFTDVDAFLALHPTGRKNFDHQYREFSLIDLAKEHRNLGTINPVFTHRVLALYIKNVDAVYNGQRFTSTFMEEQKLSAEIAQEVCRKYFEVLSRGKMSLSFERVEVDSALTGMYGDTFIQGDINSLVPYPAQAVFAASNKADSYVFYYSTAGFRPANGASPTALGGTTWIPFIPDFLFGPRRGRIVISSALLDRPGTLLHELFHNMEYFYNIKPAHGYMDETRSVFPLWQGKGEFDYYRWHFNALFAAPSREEFSFIARYPSTVPESAFSLAYKRYAQLSGAEIESYKELLAKIGKADKNTDKTIPALYEELFGIYPYSYDSLLAAASYHHYYGDKNMAFSYINRAYAMNPGHSEICYMMGVSYYWQGRYEESLRYLGEGIPLSGSPAKFYQYRVTVNYYIKNYEAGNKDLVYLWKTFPDWREWVEKYLKGKIAIKECNAEAVLAGLKQ